MADPEPPLRDPDDAHLHSVFDEPAIFPRNENQPIDSDWNCSSCGYNLRGLTIGMPCPECSHVEMYAPPPPDAPSYGWWLREKQRRTSMAASWVAVVVATLLAGPMAVAGTFLSAGGMGLMLVAVIGPTVEETMKIAAVVLIVEAAPYLIKDRAQIWLIALGSAVMFAVIENILYLTAYIKNPTLEIIMWRWLACTALHVMCTAIATRGALAAWTACVERFKKPSLHRHIGPLIVAIVIHGVYNFTVVVLDYTGVLF